MVISALSGAQSKTGALAQSLARHNVAVALYLRQLIEDEFGLDEGVATVLAATVLSASSGFGISWPLAGWTKDEAARALLALSTVMIEQGARLDVPPPPA